MPMYGGVTCPCNTIMHGHVTWACNTTIHGHVTCPCMVVLHAHVWWCYIPYCDSIDGRANTFFFFQRTFGFITGCGRGVVS